MTDASNPLPEHYTGSRGLSDVQKIHGIGNLRTELERLAWCEVGTLTHADWYELLLVSERFVQEMQPYRDNERVLIERNVHLHLCNALRLMLVMHQCAGKYPLPEDWVQKVFSRKEDMSLTQFIAALKAFCDRANQQTVFPRFSVVSRSDFQGTLLALKSLVAASPQVGSSLPRKVYPLFQARDPLVELAAGFLNQNELKPLAGPFYPDFSLREELAGARMEVIFGQSGQFLCDLKLPKQEATVLGFREFMSILASAEHDRECLLPITGNRAPQNVDFIDGRLKWQWQILSNSERSMIRAMSHQLLDTPKALPYWSTFRMAYGHI